MDPTQALLEVLEALKLREQSQDNAERATLAVIVCVGLTSIRDWTWEGGYEPAWPQRQLTHEEAIQLLDHGDAL
jgi:hypothetical protein